MLLLQVLSDVIMVYATMLYINGFGISEISQRKSKLLSSTIIILFSFIVEILYMYSYTDISTALYLIMFVYAYYMVFGKIKIAQFYLAIILELLIALLSSFLTIFIFQCSSFTYINIDIFISLLLRVILLIIGILINIRSKYKHVYNIVKNIPKHIFVLIFVSLICISFLSACNNLPVNSTIKQNAITIFIVLSSIFVIIIIFSLLINVASKNYYTALNSLLKKQVTAQINHYEKLEKLNNDIRTFRHDYINHLSSINTLIEEGCYSDAQRYIERLTEATHRHEAVFITGNRLADAILTDKSDNCKDFADIDFEGCITDKIDNSDICIILANALDNAVEACRMCSGRSEISIAAQVRQGYWTMTMRNPTIGEDSEGPMKTSKEDEQNHGFGLLSIEQAVKRYDGTMKVGIKGGVFDMSVIMKIPVDE